MSLVNNKLSSIVPYASQSSAIEPSHSNIQENLKARMQNVLDDSFRAQFRDYDHFHQYGMGDIVVLVGTSTAGKTSIIQALKQLESDRLEDGGDLRSFSLDLKNLKKYNSQEIEILKKVMKDPLDIPKAIFSLERSWKIGVSPQEKIEAEEAIQRIQKTGESFSTKEQEDLRESFQNMELAMFDDAFEHSRRGGNIIFDVLNIDVLAQHLLKRNFEGPLRVVLTYCPFHVLSSRMDKRNQKARETGELSNQRIGEFPLLQFSEIYTQKEMGLAFERLTREQVIKAFDDNFDKGIANAHQEGRQIQSLDKDKIRAELLGKLGFKEGVDEVDIAPRDLHLYDLVIDTSKRLPGESAKMIHNGTYHRY